MGAPLVGVAPIFALSFMGFGMGKKLLLQGDPNAKLSDAQLCVAGGFSGILTTVIMAPGERIKCLLQVRGLHDSICLIDRRSELNWREFSHPNADGCRSQSVGLCHHDIPVSDND